jgi:regulation of enolase protein 1 (concanavalin A-like superfamily)
MKLTIAPIPVPLETASAGAWTLTEQGMSGYAGAGTDLFVDPFGAKRLNNAPMLLFPTSGDFVLQAEVIVEFDFTFDAGVLLLWQDDENWAKLCFEFSPQRNPMIVSVVTRGTSDDCNSAIIDARRVYLRVARRGAGCVFHYSRDGRLWHLVRAFRLPDQPLSAGFLVQSPTGRGCRARFTNIDYRAETIADIRSGE